MKNFEVGGISINGGKDMDINNIDIGPSSNIVAI